MILKVADFLEELLKHEKSKLAEYKLSHPPTIGDMYEGLSTDILNRAIPPQFGLKLVNGFIHIGTQELSGQIDCMLVQGNGEKIPFTDSFKWHIKDVIAVFEIKKNIFTKDLTDAFSHLQKILKLYREYLKNNNDIEERVNIESVYRTFAEMTGKVAPPLDELEKLNIFERVIFDVLLIERLSPIRIVWGHIGFKSEFSLRNSMVKFLDKNLSIKGYGVGSFPQLIICDKYFLIKANGQPYSVTLRNGFWDFYLSSSLNPVIPLLELIWTRLSYTFKLGEIWGEDLKLECFHPFIAGKYVENKEQVGWNLKNLVLSEEDLFSQNELGEWSPVFLDNAQFTIINILCREGELNIKGDLFCKFVESQKLEIDSFINSLISTRLVALDDEMLVLITEQCQAAILPTGEFVAAENNTGRLFRWIEKRKNDKLN